MADARARGQRGRSMQHEQNEGRKRPGRLLGGLLAGLIFGVPLAALLGFAAYCAALGGSAGWSALGLGAGVAAAAVAVGAFLGFLFGVPRVVQEKALGPDEPYGPNTNLDQISDWLTKILVGVGLVELGRAGPAVGNLIMSVGAALGDTDSARVMAAVLLVVFVVWGFVLSYLLTRLRAASAFLASELVLMSQETMAKHQQDVDEQADRDRTALGLVERTLNPAAGVSCPSQEDLNDAIAAASTGTRADAFIQASRQRKASRKEDKKKMEQTIPVFKALIASDTNNQYHRNHAQLGYALKDSYDPRWQEAEKALKEAIKRRDRLGRSGEGWVLYEFNHALCLIALDPDAASAEKVDEVKADLAVVARSKQVLGLLETDAVKHWSDRNHVLLTTDVPGVPLSSQHG